MTSEEKRIKHRLYTRVWRAKNRERIRANSKASRDRWPLQERPSYQAVLDRNAQWRAENPERQRELIRRWKSENKGRLAESVRFRQAQKQHATPPWLTEAHREEMREIYEIAEAYRRSGLDVHVDHVVPLVGKKVCGLHVPWNLQILPAKMNYEKSNRHASE